MSLYHEGWSGSTGRDGDSQQHTLGEIGPFPLCGGVWWYCVVSCHVYYASSRLSSLTLMTDFTWLQGVAMTLNDLNPDYNLAQITWHFKLLRYDMTERSVNWKIVF